MGARHDRAPNFSCPAINLFWSGKIKVKEIVFVNALKFSKELVEHSCMYVNSSDIIDVFNNHKRGADFRNQYLTIEGGEEDE